MVLFATLGLFLFATGAPYEPNWDSLRQHKTPQWFKDAKFGIYAHFGVYSVPAFSSEWYSHWMYVPGQAAYDHHRATYGELDTFGYKDFLPMFTAPKFNASAWAALYRRAGAMYAGPVAEHADGFAMYNSSLSEFTAVKKGPKRDIAGEIIAAVRAEGLKAIATLHHEWLWGWYPTYNKTGLPHDCADPAYQLTADHGGLYGQAAAPKAPLTELFNKYFFGKTEEVIRMYQPDVLYFDSRLGTIDESLRLQFLCDYYNLDATEWGEKGVVMTYKNQDMAVGSAVLDYERGGSPTIRPAHWQTDDAIARNTWSWVEGISLKNSTELVGELVDIVSKNGNFLLDVTPKADGSFDARVVSLLEEIGDWLALNGQAIYGTTNYSTYGEGPTNIIPGFNHEWPIFTSRDFRFTVAPPASPGSAPPALFAIAMAWSNDGAFQVQSLNSSATLPGGRATNITDVTLVGADGATRVEWSRDADALHIKVGSKPVGLRCAYVFRVHLNGASTDIIDGPTRRLRERIGTPL